MFKAVIRRIHLWVGLLLGVQFLLWMLSGVVMSWFHITLVRGETNAFSSPPRELIVSTYASPGGAIVQVDGANSLELRTFLDRAVYEVRSPNGSALFDASTGEKLSPIPEETARAVAERDYLGEGELEQITLMDNPPHEYRGTPPVWRADFDDPLHTRLYISPDTGAVEARRNDIWRIYDFFWMLHIMDYGEREDFNNPLLRAASAVGLIFALSGLVMLVFRSSRQTIAGDVRAVLTLGRKPQA